MNMPRHPLTGNSVGIGLHGLHLAYGATRVLRGIDLPIEQGEFIALLGPSGCGKTTLLRAIAGLEKPGGGTIIVGGRVMFSADPPVFVPPQKRGLGMMFQHYALWPHMSVFENIAYPLRKRGIGAAERAARLHPLAETLGLTGVLDRYPGQLSGGQQQRVALARALAIEPAVILLDEPLSNLDATLRAQVGRELRQLHRRLGTTMVMVTHDQEEAATMADRIAVLQEGALAQLGTPPQLLDHPGSRFIAEFLGFDNFLPATVLGTEGGCYRVRLDGADRPLALRHGDAAMVANGAATIALRGDAVRVRPAGDGRVAATVRSAVPRGRGAEIEACVGKSTIVMRRISGGAEQLPAAGSTIHLDLAAGRIVPLT